MKYLILIFLFSICSLCVHAQKPGNGRYTYKMAFAEWQGKSLGATCIVVIKGDSITIINDGTVTGAKGEVIDQGIILKHQKTGKWIIAHSQKDKSAKEIGGCSDGPSIIDFKKKTFYSC